MEDCLLSELKKLKESSKEAVENTDSFNSFKQYMHITRKVEKELSTLINKVKESDENHLILVCGSVGDGKSHLLSYLKSKIDYLSDYFYIHNDATESNAPNKTSMDTLSEVLSDYTDEELRRKNPNKSILLAINLGTLNNFLKSKYADKYSCLHNYVSDKNILKPKIEGNSFERDSYFQFVNLSDYQLFSLTSNGPISHFMEGSLDKLTNESIQNPFYQSYINNCKSGCTAAKTCPIKYNYELLMQDKVKQTIIKYIAELILKYKTIISSRAFFNFLYNIIVDSDIDQIADKDNLEKYLEKISSGQYLSALLPNLFFSFGKHSDRFKNISLIDPVTKRSETLDTLTITFFNTTDIYKIFSQYIEKRVINNEPFVLAINNISKEEREIALNTLIRFYTFTPKESTNSLEINDLIYNKYLSNLFYWNNGNIKNLKQLYTEVIDSIYEWNGKSETGTRMININPGRNQLKYTISQSVNIKQFVKNLDKSNQEILDKFLPYMILKFIISGNENAVLSIRIDFPLYQLLMRINEGYRPNKQDKNNYVNFVYLINNILEYSNQKEVLTITEKSGNNSKSFTILFDEDFGYEFKEK
ncbi:DNA phosphorothioation-dependent restriction protein DptF [Bacillus carboniphilus]|uniref:DNA phosphorothioation-dependent restriction protein DptF n=1 Tax=Bacillus carboniphilus TaxID=86663 RepID=A0ABY9JUZ7_9BACI|nr:DNA phosphorothioation-dependent restriction protein DptF [Bacillus carboniphilus]WLR42614.1 DNA phosphorothioation-dependent restriction protein DptF [Bacillus carboniphilus]